MSTARYCWKCGKPLQHAADGELVFKLFKPKGYDAPVRVHVVCDRKSPEPEYAHADLKRDVRKYLDPESL